MRTSSVAPIWIHRAPGRPHRGLRPERSVCRTGAVNGESMVPVITVFLDESGTHADSPGVLVGAVVTPDAQRLEQQVVAVHGDILSDNLYWNDGAKRDAFAARGFHHVEDNDTVRGEFVRIFRSMDFRAHVAFSRRSAKIADQDLILNMYYTLARNIILRYRTEELLFVFETESSLDSYYSKIIATVYDDLRSIARTPLTVAARIGTKASPALALADYVLALASIALFEKPKPFVANRINSGLDVHLAHLIDFDRRVHQSARKGIELL